MANYNHPGDFISAAMEAYKENYLEGAIYLACVAKEEYIKILKYGGVLKCDDFIKEVRSELKQRIRRLHHERGIELSLEDLNQKLKDRYNIDHVREVVNQFNRPLTPLLKDLVTASFAA